MTEGKRFTESEYIPLVISAVRRVAPDAARHEKIGEDTLLLGAGAVMDSVAFITLLIELEQSLNGTIDLSETFVDSGGMEADRNPFRTVGRLAELIRGGMKDGRRG